MLRELDMVWGNKSPLRLESLVRKRPLFNLAFVTDATDWNSNQIMVKKLKYY